MRRNYFTIAFFFFMAASLSLNAQHVYNEYYAKGVADKQYTEVSGSQITVYTVKSELLTDTFFAYKNRYLLFTIPFENGQFHGTEIVYDKYRRPEFELVYRHDTLISWSAYEYSKDTISYAYVLFMDSLVSFPYADYLYIDKSETIRDDTYGYVEKAANHGYECKYYVNGNLKEKWEIVNSEYHGKYSSYYSSGELATEAHYNHGVLTGNIVYYEKDGKVKASKPVAK